MNLSRFIYSNLNFNCVCLLQPSVVHKHFMKAVINALLQERPHLFSKDRVRALFVILQSPVFLSQGSYTVLAHVLRNITSLSNGDHQLLVSWFRT